MDTQAQQKLRGQLSAEVDIMLKKNLTEKEYRIYHKCLKGLSISEIIDYKRNLEKIIKELKAKKSKKKSKVTKAQDSYVGKLTMKTPGGSNKNERLEITELSDPF